MSALALRKENSPVSFRPNIVELKELSKHFGKLSVLDDISFKVREKEILAILGSSGSGKSTLLNIISGLLSQDEGTVYISGKSSTSYLGWGKIVYMFQEDRLLPWRTVRDNVAFGLENSQIPKSEWPAKIREVLKLVNLEDFADFWPHQLSGGMRSRVALARSLVAEPQILLMDEPFSKLDAQTRSQLHAELLRIHQLTKMTIVFVTHDVEEAVVLADRVAVFSSRPGRIKEMVDIRMERPRQLTDMGVVRAFQDLRRKI